MTYALEYAPSPSILHGLDVFDRVTLPRSNFEFDLISKHLEITYYQSTVVCWAMISASAFIVFPVLMKKAAGAIKDDTQTSTANRVFGAVLIVLIELVWHPAAIGASGFTSNHPDTSGFYFIKEGINMSLGYGCLYFVILNVWASARSQ